MHSSYVFLALDIARERAAEADAERLARLSHPSEPLSDRVRRSIARVALAVARAADDGEVTVSRPLAPGSPAPSAR
jgi:hypothetical protein